MRLILTLLVFFLLVQTRNAMAFFLFEPGGTYCLTNSKLKETKTSESGTHESFAPGCVGVEAKALIDIPLIAFGGTGLFQYESARYYYEVDGQGSTSRSSYSVTNRRLAYGALIMIKIMKGWRIFGEYYPYAQNTVTWAKDKAINPFQDKDELEGKGYGVGIGMSMDWFFIQAAFRQFSYDEGKMRGVNRTLPDSNFSKLRTSGFNLTAGLSI